MNFSKEMEMLTLVEKEFNQLESDGSWHSIYLAIRNKSSSYGHSVLEAKKIVNKNLNRYRDVSPYDHSRVILEKGKCDYINASLVKVPEANREYILTQGPLPETAGHFWLMVWEQKTKAIIMLNKIIEKDQIKCHYYWIEDANSPLIFQEEGLRIDFLAQTEESDFITREFRITDQESGETRSVFQFHFLTWPDFGVPSSPASFLHFLEYVRNTGTLDLSPETGPPVVHCSAGIGRSGTFCLVDSCLIMLKDEDGPSKVSVQQLLLDMRHYRMGLIQTPEQLRFSYLAIIEALKEMKENAVIPLFPYVSDSGIENGVLEEEPDGEGIEEEEEVPPPIESLPPPVPPRSQSLPSSPVTLTQEEEEREMPISNKPLPSLPSSVEESSEEHEWEDIDEALPDIELSAVGDYSIGLDDARKRNNEERTVGTEPKKLKSDLAVDSTLANGNGAVAGMKDFNVPDVTTKLCPEESEPKVRQRRKDNKLEEKVRKIKQKMEASERSQRRKAMLCSPYAMAVGGMLLLLTGVVAYKYFS